MSILFQEQLRQWRARRGCSQLSLSLDAGVSARHLSFLETGRSRPSRKMVLRLATALDLPLRESNELLAGAGFAPRFGDRQLNHDEMKEARRAVRLMLDAHEPCPAFALDRYWNLLEWNRPQAHMLRDIADDDGSLAGINALDLIFEPTMLREQLVNWEEVARAVLLRVRRQVNRSGSMDRKLQDLWTHLLDLPGLEQLTHQVPATANPPVLVPIRMRMEGTVLTWFSTLSVFGATGDITLDEMVIESFFPGDHLTREYVATELAPASLDKPRGATASR
jgi:transcriptional regulator with XRE-family HTH domain